MKEYNTKYDIRNIINYIVRYEEHDKTECWIRINDTSFHILFCRYCGNYFDIKHDNIRNLSCTCDKDSIIYENYQDFINNFPDYTSGDEIDDYIEHPEYAHKGMLNYIYKMILFGITYKNFKNIHKDKYIENNILEYL